MKDRTISAGCDWTAGTNVNVVHFGVRLSESEMRRRADWQTEKSLMPPCYGQKSHITEDSSLTVFKPSGNYTHHQVEHSQILRSAHIVYLCVLVDLRTNSDYLPIQH